MLSPTVKLTEPPLPIRNPPVLLITFGCGLAVGAATWASRPVPRNRPAPKTKRKSTLLLRFMFLFLSDSQDQFTKFFHLFRQIVDALFLLPDHPLLLLHRLHERHDKTGIAETVIFSFVPRDLQP